MDAGATLEHVTDDGGGEGGNERPPGLRPYGGDNQEQGRSVADEGPVAGVGGDASEERGEGAE